MVEVVVVDGDEVVDVGSKWRFSFQFFTPIFPFASVLGKRKGIINNKRNKGITSCAILKDAICFPLLLLGVRIWD